MRILVIRHAQTEWNDRGLAQGHTDIELDASGERQARLLGERLRHLGRVPIYSSDLKRAKQTASAICELTGSPLHETELLRERKLGEWEGMPWQEFQRLSARIPDRIHGAPPGGESLAELWTRVERFRTNLSHSGDVCIVTHGGAACVLIAQYLLGTIEASKSFRLANASFTELERRSDGTFFLAMYNCIDHLSDKPLQGDLSGVAR